VRVERYPTTNAPPGVAEAWERLRAEPFVPVPREAWGESERAPRPLVTERLAEAREWVARPALRLDLAVGTPEVRIEGRPLPPSLRGERWDEDFTRTRGWLDEARGLALWWETRKGALYATAAAPPEGLELGYRIDPASLEARLELPLAPGSSALALRCRATLDRVERDALLAPAPCELRLPLDGLVADELAVSLAVPDLGFELEDGRLVRTANGGDGVRFAIDVESRSGVRTRAWSLDVRPGDRWVEARVDLRALAADAGTVRLVTEPGEAGDPRHDYAVWSDLRLHGPPARAPSMPNVILIDADTLRADRLGCYGQTRPTSPRIDAWAAEHATLYENASAAANWTLPSTVSILTGLTVLQHGVRDYPCMLGAEHEPIAARLRAAGYETRARTDGGFVATRLGFGTGFDVVDERARAHEEHDRIGWGPELEFLRDRRSERPIFYFLQTYSVHAPHLVDRRFEEADPPYEGRWSRESITRARLERALELGEPAPDAAEEQYVVDVYDAAVRRLDDVVGDFLDGVQELYRDQDLLVVFTSDHGEELFDHGSFGHGHTLYEELLHVPLIVRFPGQSRGRRVAAPVTSLDLVPTILDCAGLPVPPHLPGRSLREATDEPRLRVAEYLDTTAVRLGSWKLVLGASTGPAQSIGTALFDLERDPAERVDRTRGEPQRAARLRALLESWSEEHPARVTPSTADLPAAALDDLRALGYLGGD